MASDLGLDMEASGEEGLSGASRYATRHWRFNFAVMAFDFTFYSLALAFASTSTILPAFAERLGAPNIVIGAMPAISTLGYAVPPLLVANFVERLPRKLPYILAGGLGERLTYLVFALAAFLLAGSHPAAALLVTMLALVVFTMLGGAILPAWMDMFGKVMPMRYRGRQFAVSGAMGAAIAIGGALISGRYLAHLPFPQSYGYCFISGFAAFMVSYVFLASTREAATPPSRPRVPLASYLRRLPEILRRDHAFGWYMVSKCVGTLASMGLGFYTVFALRTLAAAEWQVAHFTLMMLAGQAVASLAMGYVADRVGHKRMMVAGALGVLAANGLALVATQVWQIYLVFLFVSLNAAAMTVSDLNLALEFATETERPTYIALSMSLVAPIAFLSPLIGGLLADLVSYRAVFALAAISAAAYAALLTFRVRDPRRLQADPGITPRL